MPGRVRVCVFLFSVQLVSSSSSSLAPRVSRPYQAACSNSWLKLLLPNKSAFSVSTTAAVAAILARGTCWQARQIKMNLSAFLAVCPLWSHSGQRDETRDDQREVCGVTVSAAAVFLPFHCLFQTRVWKCVKWKLIVAAAAVVVNY